MTDKALILYKPEPVDRVVHDPNVTPRLQVITVSDNVPRLSRIAFQPLVTDFRMCNAGTIVNMVRPTSVTKGQLNYLRVDTSRHREPELELLFIQSQTYACPDFEIATHPGARDSIFCRYTDL